MTGFIILTVVVLVIWCVYQVTKLDTRCPTCGRDLKRGPHHPRCNYWRDSNS